MSRKRNSQDLPTAVDGLEYPELTVEWDWKGESDIEEPGLGSEPVFFHDDVKPTVNRLVEQWREQRE